MPNPNQREHRLRFFAAIQRKADRDYLAMLTAGALMLVACGMFIGSWLGE